MSCRTYEREGGERERAFLSFKHVWLIKTGFLWFIFDPFKSLYDLFDFWKEWIQKGAIFYPTIATQWCKKIVKNRILRRHNKQYIYIYIYIYICVCVCVKKVEKTKSKFDNFIMKVNIKKFSFNNHLDFKTMKNIV